MKILRSTLALVLLCATSLSLVAQQKERVLPVITTGKDATWYAQQYELWDKEVKQHPKSEDAWRNLFTADFYLNNWFTEERPPLDSVNVVLQRMEQAIPGSFTYNYCVYKNYMDGTSEHAERALQLMPRDADLITVDCLLAYLWRTGADADKGRRGAQFTACAKKLYEGHYYPEYALRYNDNQLLGLPENAIFLGNGDLEVLPKIVLQRAMNLHQGKTVVPSVFLYDERFRDSLCSQLRIQPFRVNGESVDFDHFPFYFLDFIKYVSAETGRPIYFGPSVKYLEYFVVEEQLELLKSCLYSEGLVQKYSPEPYDNTEASLRAIEKYKLDFFTDPNYTPKDEWEGSKNMQLHYMELLYPYIQVYKDLGNMERAEWLRRTLRASITNTNLDEDAKNYFLPYLDDSEP
jgi:hypothetical protein